MTSPNWNIFGVTGSMWGDFLSQRALTRSFGNCLICVWTHGWTNNRDAGDLRRHRAHYEVAVIVLLSWTNKLWNCRLCEIDTPIDYFAHIISTSQIRFRNNFNLLTLKTHSLNIMKICQFQRLIYITYQYMVWRITILRSPAHRIDGKYIKWLL